jgi:carbon storage regulator
MLVLSRKEGEQIVLPTLGVTITLVQMRGDKARIGIDAPKNVPVHRSQIWDEIVSLGPAALPVESDAVSLDQQIEAIEGDIQQLHDSYVNRLTGKVEDKDALEQIGRLKAVLATLNRLRPRKEVPAA